MPKSNDHDEKKKKKKPRPCAGSAAGRCAPAWLLRRPLSYADGKPRPLLRGVLHGAVAVVGALLTLALLTEHVRWRPFAAFVGLKTVTAAASARFHLAPFLTAHAARRALILDLICVPCSIWGNACLIAYTPIQPAFRGDAAGSALSAGMHAMLAGCFVINGLLVWYQFSGGAGGAGGAGGNTAAAHSLATPRGRSDGPRMKTLALMSVLAYGAIYVLLLRPMTSHPNPHHNGIANWCWAGLAIGLVGAALAQPVTYAHAEDLSWCSTLPWRLWHVKEVWGLHEDMHLAIFIADACWVVFGLQLVGLEW